MSAVKGFFLEISSTFKKTFVKYPVTMVISLAVAILSVYLVEYSYGTDGDYYYQLVQRIVMLLALAIPLSVGISLYFIYKPAKTVILKAIPYVVVALILVIYDQVYLKAFDDSNWVRTSYALVLLAVVAIWMMIPVIYSGKNFEGFFAKVFSSYFNSIFLSQLLALGLMGIVFAVFTLLLDNSGGDIYYDIWIFVNCLFVPGFFLGQIPLSEEEKTYSSIMKVLFAYIVLPVFLVYSLVICLYFIKLIFTNSWVEGHVAALSIAQILVGILLIVILKPLENVEAKLPIKKLRSLIPFIMIPVCIMYFVAIGMRIMEYGFTEIRYIGLGAGIWAAFTIVWLIVKRSGSYAPVIGLFTAIALIMAIGPISGENISTLNQKSRLESLLVKNKMLNENKTAIIPAVNPDAVPFEDKRSICSIISYMQYREKNVPPYVHKALPGESTNMQVLGFGYVSIYEDEESYNLKKGYNSPGEYISLSYRQGDKVLSVKGYDYVIEGLYIYDDQGLKVDEDITVFKEKDKTDSVNVVIRVKGMEELRIDFKDMTKKLYEKYGSSKPMKVNGEDMTVLAENKDIAVKCIAHEIILDVRPGPGESIELALDKSSLYIDNFSLLLKKK